MSKSLLTILVILLSFSSAFAASANGRVKMIVVRTNVAPADVNVVKTISTVVANSQAPLSYTVETVY